MHPGSPAGPHPLVGRFDALSRRRPSPLEMVAWLSEGGDGHAPAGTSDPHHPYAREVLLATDFAEVMLATWNRDWPCAPHDHGGSSGAVRVLRGTAIHRVYDVAHGRLDLVRESRHRAGSVLAVGPDLVHAMADGGDEEALVTLHLYAGPIPHMVVYDVERRRTVVVGARCGAWVPHEPELVVHAIDGWVRPSDVLRHSPGTKGEDT